MRGALRAVIVFYALIVLVFIWLTRDMTFATLTRDPLFAGYSIAVVLYVFGRVSAFYRSTPDKGYRPTVSIIVPAFDEEDGIEGIHDPGYSVRRTNEPAPP